MTAWEMWWDMIRRTMPWTVFVAAQVGIVVVTVLVTLWISKLVRRHTHADLGPTAQAEITGRDELIAELRLRGNRQERRLEEQRAILRGINSLTYSQTFKGDRDD